ncbi:MAG: hypothetical protein M3457_03280 [Chloroflexota bacterium]|nr:hypothetical protein [Chloroflexota bacterium]
MTRRADSNTRSRCCGSSAAALLAITPVSRTPGSPPCDTIHIRVTMQTDLPLAMIVPFLDVPMAEPA